MAVETVAEGVEQVAGHLEEVAQATRQIDTRALKFFGSGSTLGMIVGFFFGYRWDREKIRAEQFKKSSEDLERMRQYYEKKERAEKPSVDEVVQERGYVVVEEPPVEERVERPLRPPVPLHDTTRSTPQKTEDGKSKDEGWSYPRELSRRSPDRPYIIHQDEFHTNETGYRQVTYTYYAGDGVVTDERDEVIADIDNLLGLENLTRWGHGADDINVLYLRNSALELEFEVCRTPKSYEQEVLGLEHSGDTHERTRRRGKGRRNVDGEN